MLVDCNPLTALLRFVVDLYKLFLHFILEMLDSKILTDTSRRRGGALKMQVLHFQVFNLYWSPIFGFCVFSPAASRGPSAIAELLVLMLLLRYASLK